MSKEEPRNYNVVFEYTKKAGGYEGVRTWSSYLDKEELNKFHTSEHCKQEKIIAEGVSPEEAVRLCKQTRLRSRIGASLQEATMPDGKINKDILKHQLEKTIITHILDNEE